MEINNLQNYVAIKIVIYFQCPFCSKAFLNSSFLQSHITRRHAEYSGKAASVAVTADDRQVIGESPALQELQARLEATEAQLQQQRMTVRFVYKYFVLS